MKIFIGMPFIIVILFTNGLLFSILPEDLVFNIRNPKTNAKEFRDSLESIGECLALEILTKLPKKHIFIQTMTGATASHFLSDETPVLVTILRAGLPLHMGVQKVFPNSEVGFFAMARDEKTLESKIEYIALPDIRNKYIILSDTMLATGGSIINAIRVIQNYSPKKIFIITALASKYGIDRVWQEYPNITIFTAAVDPYINSRGYIIPGLGDAGDRSYGEKHIDKITFEETIFPK